MTLPLLTRWKEVAALLEQGWRIEGFYVVSPTGERRGAWLNAIRACEKRGLVTHLSLQSALDKP
jgi:hypothetical protein